MNDYDIEQSEERILESLKTNGLKRNIKLNNLIKLLNNIDCGKIISIDGKWGCGKTVFLKQLQMLNEKEVGDIEDIDKDYLKDFKNKYIIYYYNAWENDYHISPLLSLIYNLINDYPYIKNRTASNRIELPFNFKETIKTISSNFIDIDKVESFKDIASNIYTIEEKKEALYNLLNFIIPRNKKMILVIDELDRCKPSYAVELLEIIKHFYLNDKLILIVGTNNEQLSNTISNYYGSEFDGYGYLTKFYNLIIELEEISPKKYLDSILSISDSSRWVESSIHAVCNYFNFQMRDINRLISDFDILDEYFSTTRGGIYREDDILKYVFLPYSLALKLKNKKQLDKFMQGDGYDDLEKYVKSNKKVFNIVMYDYKNKNASTEIDENIDDNTIKSLKEKYNSYFSKNIDNWDMREAKNEFLNVFGLLNKYTSFKKDRKE